LILDIVIASSARRRGVGTELVLFVLHKPKQSAANGCISIAKITFVGWVDVRCDHLIVGGDPEVGVRSGLYNEDGE
jgi:hypothetical protein